MTQNGPEAAPAIPVGLQIGQVVGQAQSVLSGLLTGVLEETQTNNETYLALQRMALLGGQTGRDRYVRDLSDWLDLDLWNAGELADSLIAAGLITAADGTVRLSDAGTRLRASIVGSMGAVTTPLWRSFDPADLETTVTTLREITLRARSLSSAPAPSGVREGRS
ncbi:MAG: hypothetical protein ABSA02_37085 [Trebonia sp.]|jgi:hypothetical protein